MAVGHRPLEAVKQELPILQGPKRDKRTQGVAGHGKKSRKSHSGAKERDCKGPKREEKST